MYDMTYQSTEFLGSNNTVNYKEKYVPFSLPIQVQQPPALQVTTSLSKIRPGQVVDIGEVNPML
jgi:hypothetical protein